MMNMKRTLYKLIGCALLLAASVLNSNAANGIIETRNYKICPGDTISVTVVNPNREVVVFKDTVWQDTIRVADPSLDSIYQFVVNVYPRFELMEYKELEVGQSFEWCGTTITQAGIYERRHHSQHLIGMGKAHIALIGYMKLTLSSLSCPNLYDPGSTARSVLGCLSRVLENGETLYISRKNGG